MFTVFLQIKPDDQNLQGHADCDGNTPCRAYELGNFLSYEAAENFFTEAANRLDLDPRDELDSEHSD